MSLVVRLWLVLLRALRRGKLPHTTDASVLTLRVWLNDLDIAGHMNNGRYATIMDLGRLDFFVRHGMLRALVRNRWRPFVAATAIRYHRSLAPFVRYDLSTRLLCWDDKWFFFEQRFARAGELHAQALVKTVVKSPAGTVRPADLLSTLGLDAVSPPPPPAVRAWQDSIARQEPHVENGVPQRPHS
jgi:acyl-CoA thioesterase FadM